MTSPGLWWNGGSIHQRATKFAATFAKRELRADLPDCGSHPRWWPTNTPVRSCTSAALSRLSIHHTLPTVPSHVIRVLADGIRTLFGLANPALELATAGDFGSIVKRSQLNAAR